MAEDSLLFIDANIYLDLYRESQNKEIFDQLKELSTEIFSTQQVVDEVRRRRKDIVLKILDRFPKARLEMKLTAWPEHLLDLKKSIDSGSLFTEYGKLNQDLNTLKKEFKKQLFQNTDPVSLTLDLILSRPVPHTDEELKQARERRSHFITAKMAGNGQNLNRKRGYETVSRDRGNPPGKGGKLGDQLNWEQLLTQVRNGRARLWIVSRDKDYGVFTEGTGVLHELLYDDLRKINKDAEAFLFDDLGKGLDAFIASRSPP
jgi:regulator of replication initiation timing